MRQLAQGGKPIFTHEDMRTVKEAILATVPSFEGGAVTQKNLTPESSLLAVAVALADLGEAGMDKFESFISGSKAEFRETNIGLGRMIAGMRKTGEPIADYVKEQYRQKMVAWSKGQIGFIGGREKLLETDIAALTGDQKGAVRRLFVNFAENIKRMRETLKEREGMTFEQLAANMGYELTT